jgi:hypothetical protein
MNYDEKSRGFLEHFAKAPSQYDSTCRELAAFALNLWKWVDDLLVGMQINCIYCGFRYVVGPDGPPRQALLDHIKACPGHPLQVALARITLLEEALRKAKQPHRHCDDSWYCCPACDCEDHPAGSCGGDYIKHGGTWGKCACGADKANAAIDKVLNAG